MDFSLLSLFSFLMIKEIFQKSVKKNNIRTNVHKHDFNPELISELTLVLTVYDNRHTVSVIRSKSRDVGVSGRRFFGGLKKCNLY